MCIIMPRKTNKKSKGRHSKKLLKEQNGMIDAKFIQNPTHFFSCYHPDLGPQNSHLDFCNKTREPVATIFSIPWYPHTIQQPLSSFQICHITHCSSPTFQMHPTARRKAFAMAYKSCVTFLHDLSGLPQDYGHSVIVSWAWLVHGNVRYTWALVIYQSFVLLQCPSCIHIMLSSSLLQVLVQILLSAVTWIIILEIASPSCISGLSLFCFALLLPSS